MEIPAIHPNWARAPASMTDGYSLEMIAKDRLALRAAAPKIAPETPIAITFLPNESMEDRVAAAVEVRKLGFEPMPHLSARRIASREELEGVVERTVKEAGVKRVFLVAGDPPVPAGPFPDTLALLATGVFERAGIQAVGVAGHPEGHPNMTEAECWQALEAKHADIERRGMATLIVTQFGFSTEPFFAWLKALRGKGFDMPVRIGVPGPAGVKTLLRFASRCGVGASASVMAKYGISLTNLIGSAGPDALIDEFAKGGLATEYGPVRLHFYPFGGFERTVDWINEYEKKR